MICLLETWCGEYSEHDEICNVLLEYQPNILLGTKRKKKGRYSGGILVLIKKTVIKHFKRTKLKFKHGILFDVHPIVCNYPVILIITYLPPEGAKVYGLDESNGVEEGSSTVDYTLVSTVLFERITRFEIGEEDQYTHLPQMFNIKLPASEKDSKEYEPESPRSCEKETGSISLESGIIGSSYV